MSLIHGPSEPPLSDATLRQLIDEQALQHGDRTSVIFPAQNVELSFNQLAARSKILAKALIAAGLKFGDSVGVFAPNIYQYLEVFCAAGRIGCPSVSFNITYTPTELAAAARFTSCKAVFITSFLGPQNLAQHLAALGKLATPPQIILLDSNAVSCSKPATPAYDAFFNSGITISSSQLTSRESEVQPTSTLNIQFTSGTTSTPKACLLSHHNLINNARFLIPRLPMHPTDTLVAPLPLFHCFGLVSSFLTSFLTGSRIIFPSPLFDPTATIRSVVSYSATMLHSVPTMFVAEIEAVRKMGLAGKIKTLQRGVVAGSPVPMQLMRQIEDVLGMRSVFSALGMTETSPGSFIGGPDDSLRQRLESVGRILPHTVAKIVDSKTGQVVKRGQRGELLVGGYLVCQGYLKQQQKTDEVMSVDEKGTRWMKTGDECYFDEDGFCYITGRIKDIIIRGGENIYPTEVEGRLAEHKGIAEASVIGLKDDRWGEVVAAFLRATDPASRPADGEVRDWVGSILGKHKVPQHVFWIGDSALHDFPKTGSGKHQKHVLRDVGERLRAKPLDVNASKL